MTKIENAVQDPHQNQPVLTAGVPLEQAQAAMLMIHGRGARAEDILSLSNEFAVPGFAYLAPQAAGNTWYPHRFLEPTSSNEPWLTSSMRLIDAVLDRIVEADTPLEATILLGFSQGACLALEYAARHAKRYGGLVGLSGALIGPDDSPRKYAGSLAGTPVFLGCSDVDFHVPKERVHHAAETLQSLKGEVKVRLYPNFGHQVNADEIGVVRTMMQTLVGGLPLPPPRRRA